MSAELIVDVIEGENGLEKLGSLLDRSFGVPAGARFFDDFPVWDEHFETGVGQVLRVGVFEKDKQGALVTSACVKLASLRTPSKVNLPIALIGGVATDANYRGKGLASRAVELAVSWAEERGAAMCLLWGSEHSLYKKIGFEPCGEQVRIPLASFLPGLTDLTNYSTGNNLQIHEGWNPKILDFLKNRTEGLYLDARDQRWLEAHKNVHWYWVGDHNKVTAYAGLGRGIDLQGMVHEWGGERSALIAIFSQIQKLVPVAELLGGPAVYKSMGFLYQEDAIEPLCLARLAAPAVVYSAFANNQALDPKLIADLKPQELARLFFWTL